MVSAAKAAGTKHSCLSSGSSCADDRAAPGRQVVRLQGPTGVELAGLEPATEACAARHQAPCRARVRRRHRRAAERLHAAYDEAYYAGEYFDHSPYGGVGASIAFHHVDDGGYSRDPRRSSTGRRNTSRRAATMSWRSLKPRQECAQIVLRHHLSRDPTRDEVDAFVEEIANEWEDGYSWALCSGELASRLGL